MSETRYECRRVLGQHALARVNQDDGQSAVEAPVTMLRCIVRSRRIGDENFSFVSREEAIGDIDCDALLALSSQPSTKRKVDLAALSPNLLGVDFERRPLVLEDHLRV